MTTKIAHLFEKSVWPWGQIKAFFPLNAYEKVIIGILMRQDHGRIRCIIKTVTFVYTFRNAYELSLFFQNTYDHIHLA